MAKIYKIDRPLNPNLPYFAYDAFKPGQVAFPIIKHFIIDIKMGLMMLMILLDLLNPKVCITGMK